MAKSIWERSEEVFAEAADLVFEVVEGNLDRDYVRTEPITNAILAKFGHKATSA